MSGDPWAEFDAAFPIKDTPTRRARVTRENPRSQVATDPYLNLVDIDEAGFKVKDPTSTVFGYPEQFYIVEVTHSVAKGELLGYGYRILRDGNLSARMSSEAIPIRWDDIPARFHERLQP